MLLVDASVWVAMVEAAHRFHSQSLEILHEIGRPLAALDLTLYEIGNALGAKQGRFEQASDLVRVVAARCGEDVIRVDADLLEEALRTAREHSLTVYDAAYVAAARRGAMTLVSVDVVDLVSKGLAVTPDAALYP